MFRAMYWPQRGKRLGLNRTSGPLSPSAFKMSTHQDYNRITMVTGHTRPPVAFISPDALALVASASHKLCSSAAPLRCYFSPHRAQQVLRYCAQSSRVDEPKPANCLKLRIIEQKHTQRVQKPRNAGIGLKHLFYPACPGSNSQACGYVEPLEIIVSTQAGLLAKLWPELQLEQVVVHLIQDPIFCLGSSKAKDCLEALATLTMRNPPAAKMWAATAATGIYPCRIYRNCTTTVEA